MGNEPISDRRLYFTADKSQLVEEGDPRGAFLACAAGDPIPDPPKEEKAAPQSKNKAADKSPNKGQK